MTRDPRGFMPGPLPRPLTAVFWVTVIAFGLLSLAIAVQYPGTTNAGRSVEAAAAKLLAGSALIGAGLYVSFGWRRPASGALVRAGRRGLVPRGVEQPCHRLRSGVHARTRRLRDRTRVVAHAVLAYPSGRLASPLERLTIVVAYVDTVLVLGYLRRCSSHLRRISAISARQTCCS